MSEPNLCLFYKHERILAGWISETRKNKFVIQPEQGSEWMGSASQMAYSWKGEVPSNGVPAFLEEKMVWARNEATEIDLETIHELCEPGDSFTLDELSSEFQGVENGGWDTVALFLAIREDGIFFQQKKNQFVCRSQEEIEKLHEAGKKKKEQEEKLELEQEWANSLKAGSKPEIAEELQSVWSDFIHRLKNFAIYLEKSQEKKYFLSLFGLSMADLLQLEKKLVDILALAGSPCSWGSLQLIRASVAFEFDGSIEDEVKEVSGTDIWASPFSLKTKDETGLEAFSIDNEETRDFDDAFSLEKNEEGTILRVHIADVASYILPDTRLFNTAVERTSSVYTLKRIFPMFPEILSEQRFSLSESMERPVMTFYWKYNNNQEAIESGIYRSVIRVRKNLTYDEADEKIEQGDESLIQISGLTQKNKQLRLENGALDMNRKEVILDISDPQSIKIQKVRENSAASELIQELAIMANNAAARYCRDLDAQAFYRSQPPYQVSKSVPEGEKPTLKDLQIKPAKLSLEASEHSGLGLDVYLQATSPIRRFADLICQHIIFSLVAEDKENFPEETLLSWSQRAETTQKEYLQVERELIKHWKIKFLAQNSEEIFHVQKQRQLRSGNFLLLFDDIQLTHEVSLAFAPEEDDFKIQLNQIDTRTHRLAGIPVDQS